VFQLLSFQYTDRLKKKANFADGLNAMGTNKSRTDKGKLPFSSFSLVLIKEHINYIVAIFLFFFFLLFSLTPMANKMENSFYDLGLMFKPEVEERSDVLLLNVDDLAIEKVGSWPWSRDVLGNVLIRFRELGGKATVFDIEYLSPSLQAINKEYIEEILPEEYNSVRSEIKEYIEGFSSSLKNGSMPLSDAENEGRAMSEYLDGRVGELSDALKGHVFKDNDEYFAKAIRFFGNTFLTINAVEINLEDTSKDAKDFAYEHLLYSNVEDENEYIKNETLRERGRLGESYGIAPAILPLIQNAKGAGFPNVIIDADGVRRRIPLLSEYNGKYVGQLVFSPLLSLLKPEKIVRKKRELILKNVASKDGLKDIAIPLDESGNLLINWLKKKFIDEDDPSQSSFKNLSTYSLIYADELEKNLLHSLDDILSLDIRSEAGYLSYHHAVVGIKENYATLQAFKEALLDGRESAYNEYFKQRIAFFSSIEEFLNGNSKEELDSLLQEVIDSVGQDEGARQLYTEVKERVTLLFGNTQTFYTQYTQHVQSIKPICDQTFAIIGYSGVGTSDLGTNPFWNSYPNVGTHANVYNTIMSGQFIRSVPRIWSIIVSFVLAIVSAFLLKRLQKGWVKIVFGLALTVALFASFVAVFAFLSVYFQIFMPLATVALNFVLISFLSFIFTEKEKSFLRRAFAVYLSDDVVSQIVTDPSQLSLGGKAKRITALFTDIKSFSTLSEKISPEHLVSVLNIYLTRMSDIILEEKGTIDKYIGDAIVSFFGAPLDLPLHATHSCYAALRMKEAEDEINRTLFDTGKIPMAIKTRIGINTGEMVVGNMGTEKKMNYTIMGNDVNLAARLEGVNKKYGTWILVSESTWNETHGTFLGRRLDRVRVVGINTPVQLYNVMAVKKEASDVMIKLCEQFETGISLYRERKYNEALQAFRECQKIDENDEPTKLYIERMEELVANPELAATHDDIVNMTSK